MTEERTQQLFRAVIKDMFRKKGLRFDRKEVFRNIGQEVVEFNKRHNLNKGAGGQLFMPIDTPLTQVEFIQFYLEFMKELTAEHFAEVEAKLTELKEGEKKKA